MLENIKIKHKQLKTDALFTIRPNTSDIKAIKQVYEIQSYKRKIFQVGHNEKWLDMGANIGAFGVYAGQYGAEVIAFEADTTNAKLTKNNLDQNGVKNQVIQAAIMPDSYAKNTIDFHVFQGSRPMAQRRHSIYKPKKDFTTVTCPIVRFSDTKKYGHNCLKMNIEGVEIEIIKENEDFGWIQKMVLEWSFDKEPNVDVLRTCLSKLKKHFRYVDINRTIKDDLKLWTFYPPNAFIYCIK